MFAGQPRHQPALVGVLVGVLQEQIESEFGIVAQMLVAGQGGGRLHGLAPGLLERGVSALLEQRVAPGDADRKQLDQRVVLAAVKLALPDQVAGVGGPAADVDQCAVEIVLDRPLRDPELPDHPGDGRQRLLRQAGDGGAESADAHGFRVAVVAHRGPPRGVGSPGPHRQRPCRLTLVEIGSAPLGDLVDHEGGARGVPIALGLPVQDLGHGGDDGAGPRSRRRIARRRLAQCGHVGRGPLDPRRRGQCSLEVAVLDGAGRQCLAVEAARHQHVHPGHPAHRGAGGGECLVDKAEERVDRDEVLERPQGCDLAAGAGDGGLDVEVRGRCAREVGGEAHGLAGADGECRAHGWAPSQDLARAGRAGQKRRARRLASVLT
jgi:hypothetical protein